MTLSLTEQLEHLAKRVLSDGENRRDRESLVAVRPSEMSVNANGHTSGPSEKLAWSNSG